MNRATWTCLLFVALLFAVSYLRAIYFPQDRIEVYHHHNDKNHAKVSEAMKMAMKAKLEEEESLDYVSEEIPFDFPKQKIDENPYEEYDDYDWQPGGLLKARNRYLALQLVQRALRTHIKTLIHDIKILLFENLQRNQGTFSRICTRQSLYGEEFLRAERTFTRVFYKGHSRLFRALLEERQHRKKMLIRIVQHKICIEQQESMRIFKRIIRILHALY